MGIFEYFEANDTLRVFEPPQRNSGIIGGKFLSRGRYQNGVTGERIRWEMFKVGALIRLNSYSLSSRQSALLSRRHNHFSPAFRQFRRSPLAWAVAVAVEGEHRAGRGAGRR